MNSLLENKDTSFKVYKRTIIANYRRKPGESLDLGVFTKGGVLQGLLVSGDIFATSERCQFPLRCTLVPNCWGADLIQLNVCTNWNRILSLPQKNKTNIFL